MARIEPTAQCPHCGGAMKRATQDGRHIYECKTCDGRDPMEVAQRWLAGHLKPPSK